MPIQQRRDIQQDHGTSLGLTHAVIFRYILEALKRDDKADYHKWFNRLQDDQKKVVRRLRGYTGGALLKIFEDLASFRLEWDYFCFGRLALIMEAKCEEVSTAIVVVSRTNLPVGGLSIFEDTPYAMGRHPRAYTSRTRS